MKKATVFIILAVLSTAFIFSNSCQSAAVSSEHSGRIVSLIMRYIDIDNGTLTTIIRKLAHVFEFFVQSVWIGLALIALKYFSKNIIYILFCGLLTACIDEFLQLFFDGRGSMVSDIFIDFSGTLIGIVFCTVIYMLINKRKKYKSPDRR